MLPLLLLSTLLPSAALAVPAASADKTFADCAKDVPIRLTSSPDFAQLIKPFNLRVAFTPAVVALPENYQHVQTLVTCGAKYRYRVSARSGGHSYNAEGLGGENGHIVVDLENLHQITYDKTTTYAKVQGGARLGNIAQAIYDDGKRGIPHGTCPPVGVGGHSLHGGFGISGRMWGLMLDNILSVQVVTADGKLQTASEKENPDLFWALRGAGPSFGIVVEFTFKTYEATENNVNYSYDFKNIDSSATMAEIANTIQDYVKDAPKELGIGMSLFGGNGKSIQFSGVYYGKQRADFDKWVNPLLAKLPVKPTDQDVHMANWTATLIRYAGTPKLTLPPTGYNEHDTFFAKSLVNDMDHPFTSKQWQSYFDYATAKGQPQSDKGNHWFVIANLYGGGNSAINDKNLLKTAAYPHRNSAWVFQFYGTTNGQVSTAANDEVEGFMAGFVKSISEDRVNIDAAYANYQDPTLTRQMAGSLYYGDSLGRLQKIKAQVDPRGVFTFPQSIEGNSNSTNDDPTTTYNPTDVPTGSAFPSNANGGGNGTYTAPTATGTSSASATSSHAPSSGASSTFGSSALGKWVASIVAIGVVFLL